MWKLLVAVAVVSVLIVATEFIWRQNKYHSEITRKFVHMSVGTFAAFWPWLLNWDQIELLAGVFLVGVLLARTVTILSKLFTIFGSVHLIGRKTVGELFFSLSIGVVGLATHNRYLFMAAILHMSIADGLAAVVGTHFGQRTQYTVLGQRKSVAGSLTFLLCSAAILVAYFVWSHASGAWPVLAWLPITATVLENVGIRGSDNVLVPLMITVVLR